MEAGADVLIFTLPLCGRCMIVKNTLSEIQREHPEVSIKELSLITNLGLAQEHGIVSLPGLLVHGKPLKGIVSKREILEALGLPVVR
jgi:glutaredoxin